MLQEAGTYTKSKLPCIALESFNDRLPRKLAICRCQVASTLMCGVMIYTPASCRGKIWCVRCAPKGRGYWKQCVFFPDKIKPEPDPPPRIRSLSFIPRSLRRGVDVNTGGLRRYFDHVTCEFVGESRR